MHGGVVWVASTIPALKYSNSRTLKNGERSGNPCHQLLSGKVFADSKPLTGRLTTLSTTSSPAIIAVGYKDNSERAVQFRKWATGIIEEYTIKACVMDDVRIKSGGSILTEQYFEEQLKRIRVIRLSVRMF